MLITLTLQETLEKNIASNYAVTYFGMDLIIFDVLEFFISCNNCGFLLQGRQK